MSIREDGDRKILRQDTKACVWPPHKNQEKTPEIHTAFRICRLLAFTPNTMYVCSGSVFTAHVCRGDFRSEKMAIEKNCDKIPRRAYGPLIKTKRKYQKTYGVSYLQAFSFYAECHVCSGSVFTAYVCRGDCGSEKMAIEKYCDKIPRRAYGPLIKTKMKHQKYIRRFVFAGF